jgi:catechol 2,3-dioxygenase-like lactoylglutathione lyase family enzyme
MTAIRARLAHMGIFVRDREKMVKFYTDVLGLMVTDEGETSTGGAHLTFMSSDPGEHHQVVLVTGRPEDSGFNPINQVSFLVDSLGQLREVHRRALDRGATAMRTVSHGNAWSIYFLDPEGNRLEAYLHTPFYVPQPHGEPLDLGKSDDEILHATEAACAKDPGFMPREAFAAKVAARLAG